MAVPPTSGRASGPFGPIVRQSAITPSDSEVLTPMPVAIRCNAAGSICVVMRDDDTTDGVIYDVLASETLTGLFRMVKATGTDLSASNIIGQYSA